jgi:hypothetical protein
MGGVSWERARWELAARVRAPKFERPWRPPPLPPLSQRDLVRVCDALRNLDRRPGSRRNG